MMAIPSTTYFINRLTLKVVSPPQKKKLNTVFWLTLLWVLIPAPALLLFNKKLPYYEQGLFISVILLWLYAFALLACKQINYKNYQKQKSIWRLSMWLDLVDLRDKFSGRISDYTNVERSDLRRLGYMYSNNRSVIDHVLELALELHWREYGKVKEVRQFLRSLSGLRKISDIDRQIQSSSPRKSIS